jgi:hypothetical protein
VVQDRDEGEILVALDGSSRPTAWESKCATWTGSCHPRVIEVEQGEQQTSRTIIVDQLRRSTTVAFGIGDHQAVLAS